MTKRACEDCKRIHQLLAEYQENYKEVPVLHSMVTQLKKTIHKTNHKPAEISTAVTAPLGTNYEDIISILPYSLWPRLIE